MKFTFKTIQSTGRYKSFYSDRIEIKKNKNYVGNIDSKSNYINTPPFKIRLKIYKNDIMEDNNPNCEWKWITFKKEFNSVIEAKEFLNNNFIEINTKYKLCEL